MASNGMKTRAGLAYRGQVIHSLSRQERAGWLPMDGTTEFNRADYSKFVEEFKTEVWFLAGSTASKFKLQNMQGLYFVTSGLDKLGTIVGKTEHVLTTDNLPAHTHTEKQASVAVTASQNALLTGIGLAPITKPPTTTVADGQTGKAGQDTPAGIPLTPRALSVRILIFAGVSGIQMS